MNQEKRTYQSYLIRLRQVNDAGRVQWRASLLVPGNAQELQFEDLAALCRFLARQVGQAPDGSVATPGGQ